MNKPAVESVVEEAPGGKVDQLEGGGVLDSIFGDTPEPVASAPAPAVAAAPAPAPTPAPTPAPAAKVDPLAGLPSAVLGAKASATPAPAEPSVVAQDEAEDRLAEEIGQRFSDKDQRRAFYDARSKIKEWRTKAREQEKALVTERQKARELEAKLSQNSVNAQTAQAAPSLELQAKLSDMEKKVQQYEERIAKADLSQSESFQQQYDIPLQGIRNKVARLLVTSSRDLETAKAMTEKLMATASRDELLEALAEEPVGVQGALVNLVEDASEIRENRRIALENWKVSRAAVEEEQKRKSQTAFLHNVFDVSQKAASDLVNEGNFLLAQFPDNPAWNQGAEQRLRAAQGILQSADPETIVKYVVDGVTAGDLRKMYLTLAQAYRDLQEEASRVAGGGPTIGARASDDGVGNRAPSPKSGTDVLNNVFGPE